MRINSKVEIAVCPDCKGRGVHDQSKMVHNPLAIEYSLDVCYLCNGSGRVTIKSTTEISAYKQQDINGNRDNTSSTELE